MPEPPLPLTPSFNTSKQVNQARCMNTLTINFRSASLLELKYDLTSPLSIHGLTVCLQKGQLRENVTRSILTGLCLSSRSRGMEGCNCPCLSGRPDSTVQLLAENTTKLMSNICLTFAIFIEGYILSQRPQNSEKYFGISSRRMGDQDSHP